MMKLGVRSAALQFYNFKCQRMTLTHINKHAQLRLVSDKQIFIIYIGYLSIAMHWRIGYHITRLCCCVIQDREDGGKGQSRGSSH